MGFNCGIVGLPNVGKSTLFNALTQTAQAQSANYPFCTITPNSGIVAVPDQRLSKISAISESVNIIPAALEFIDIAGLVKGAYKGEGLGNQFLGHIRETKAIIQVVRCFDDSDITHVEGHIDPVRDIQIIETELMLADLESLKKQQIALQKKAKSGDKDAKELLGLIEESLVLLENTDLKTLREKAERFRSLNLLSTKQTLYVCNVSENELHKDNNYVQQVREYAKTTPVLTICAAIEAEMAELNPQEKKEYLESLGLQSSGLDRIIQAGYKLLNLMTFFTAGPKEARAWTIQKNTTAPQAAGKIHTDFEKGFIRAEITSYNDFIECGGTQNAKNKGKVRLEGKDYIVEDGDIILFRFNV